MPTLSVVEELTFSEIVAISLEFHGVKTEEQELMNESTGGTERTHQL